MKWILFIFCGIAQTALADFSNCPKSVLADPEKARAVEFLQSVAGVYHIGRCKIELNVCSVRNEVSNDDTLVGDMMLTYANGDSVYLPFDFSLNATPRTYRVILNGRRMLHYESIEHIPDRENGRTENYRLEFVKTDDLSRLEYIELGVYTSKVGASRWYICR